jgi:hypothetical protein
MDSPKGSDFLRKGKNDVSPPFLGGGTGWRLFWHFVTASTDVVVLGNAPTKNTEVTSYCQSILVFEVYFASD